MPIRSSDFQLPIELSEIFKLNVKRINDMFENSPPSKSQPIPDFPNMSLTNFAEMNKEKFVCIVNKTNCAKDPFNLRKMSSEIYSRSDHNFFLPIQ